MNKTMLLSLAFLLAPATSLSMADGVWLKMRPKDDTSGLFVRQEFCFATGEWIDEVTPDGQTEDWLWLEEEQRYVRVNAVNHKDFRGNAPQLPPADEHKQNGE